MSHLPHTPSEAEIIARQQESPSIVSLKLQFTDPGVARGFHFIAPRLDLLELHVGRKVDLHRRGNVSSNRPRSTLRAKNPCDPSEIDGSPEAELVLT